ncbi:hypothetical protein Bbelb_271190 [Branchiostoma belcheri]|nr:hypothetical protein Bbelb_271190 [Branchiostoma belcheri]
MAGAGPGSAVEPFRFEPQTDSSGDSEPDPGDDNVWDGGDVETERWRLGNRNWCRCGQDEDNRNCLEMPSVRESVCCHDLPELTDTDKNVGTDHRCIRDHPDFDVILHPANLRTLLIFRWDLIRQGVQEPVSNRAMRLIAYTSFTCWIHGRLGGRVRRVVPSCVVRYIRERYPEPSGVYVGFLEADD